MTSLKTLPYNLYHFFVPAKAPHQTDNSLEEENNSSTLRSLSAAQVSTTYDNDHKKESPATPDSGAPKSRLQLIAERSIKLRRLKYTPFFIAFIFFAIYPATREILLTNISELYIDVATYVAFTLIVIYSIEVKYKVDVGSLSAKYKYLQVPLATLLGALPGCGGAIAVASKYSTGKISFGSLVATLVATMGDAAYLLISKEPKTALLVISIQMASGIISGYIVDIFVKKNYISGKKTKVISKKFNMDIVHKITPFARNIWLLILIPGLVFAVINAFNVDSEYIQVYANITLSDMIFYLGLVGGTLSLLMWFLFPFFIFDHSGNMIIKPDEDSGANGSQAKTSLSTTGSAQGNSSQEISYIKDTSIESAKGDRMSEILKSNLMIRIISDCNFIFFWVILATLIFEYFILFSNIDLSTIFHTYAYLAILLAIVVGFIPGCGAQLIITSMYLTGSIPLAAQIGNAISNDGDALFPTLALTPKAAIYATLYSMIPALIVSFAWQFFFG